MKSKQYSVVSSLQVLVFFYYPILKKVDDIFSRYNMISDWWQVVAIKKLNEAGVQGDREFLVEIQMLSLLRHPNLVNLIGYCAEGDQRLLVYEFMPLGSLDIHLHGMTLMTSHLVISFDSAHHLMYAKMRCIAVLFHFRTKRICVQSMLLIENNSWIKKQSFTCE